MLIHATRACNSRPHRRGRRRSRRARRRGGGAPPAAQSPPSSPTSDLRGPPPSPGPAPPALRLHMCGSLPSVYRIYFACSIANRSGGIVRSRGQKPALQSHGRMLMTRQLLELNSTLLNRTFKLYLACAARAACLLLYGPIQHCQLHPFPHMKLNKQPRSLKRLGRDATALVVRSPAQAPAWNWT